MKRIRKIKFGRGRKILTNDQQKQLIKINDEPLIKEKSDLVKAIIGINNGLTLKEASKVFSIDKQEIIDAYKKYLKNGPKSFKEQTDNDEDEKYILIDKLLKNEKIQIILGTSLWPLVKDKSSTSLLQSLKAFKKFFIEINGWNFGTVKIVKSQNLNPYSFKILINSILCEETRITDPLDNISKIIVNSLKLSLQKKGYEIFNKIELEHVLQMNNVFFSDLKVSMPHLVQIIRELIRENVCIKEIKIIIDTIHECSKKHLDTISTIDIVRKALGKQLYLYDIQKGKINAAKIPDNIISNIDFILPSIQKYNEIIHSPVIQNIVDMIKEINWKSNIILTDENSRHLTFLLFRKAFPDKIFTVIAEDEIAEEISVELV